MKLAPIATLTVLAIALPALAADLSVTQQNQTFSSSAMVEDSWTPAERRA